jgi:hypothetical protein
MQTKRTEKEIEDDCPFPWQRKNPRQSSNERPPKGEGREDEITQG